MAKRQSNATRQPEVIDVPPAGEQISEDLQLATTAGEVVREFMRGIRQFFTTADTLETLALERLDQAKAFKAKPPNNQAEDLLLQKFIRQTSADNKTVVEHWKITTTISAFHKRMTGKRKIATDALEEANKIGNDLHNAFEKEEARKAAAETERLRKIAEQEEADRRQRELDALEEEAIRREEAATDLTARETAFVDLYIARGDGLSAARAAGFKLPAKDAARLLTLKKIQDAIAAKRSAAEIRRQASVIQQQPLIVDTPEVKPNVLKAAGSFQRAAPGSAELLDEAGLIDAIFSGRFGIPRTILRIDQAALNQEARDLGEQINKWPGVRYKAPEKKLY